jgi:CBS domain containing-hemolysin-like protein
MRRVTPTETMPDSDPPKPNELSSQRDSEHAPAAPARVAENGEGLMTRLLRALGLKSGTTRDELEEVLEEGAGDVTGFSPEEQALLKNILGLRERRIEDVMLPRADIIAVQQDISLGDLVKVFENAGHSRLVVYNDTLDDAIGMVHIRDLIAFMTARAAVKPEANAMRKKPLPAGLDLRKIDLSLPLSTTNIVRTLLFVPPSMPAIDLLAKMRLTRIHLALVIDEYGGTDGLVSMEDIVELIVGDIADEHDEEEAPSVVRQADGSFIADARASLDDAIATVGAEFDVGDAANDVDTLSGYVVTLAGRVPLRGEVVPGPGPFEIEVLDADPRRVKRVRIYNVNARRLERSRRETKRREALPSVANAPATSADHAAAAEDGIAPKKGAGRS